MQSVISIASVTPDEAKPKMTFIDRLRTLSDNEWLKAFDDDGWSYSNMAAKFGGLNANHLARRLIRDAANRLNVYHKRSNKSKAHSLPPFDGDIQTYIADRTYTDPITGCSIWWISHDTDGYGQVSDKLVVELYGAFQAHRMSYTLHKGQIPTGIVVRHKCRNRDCINPEHLELGTRTQNNLDKKRDGTESRGENHGMVKLTNTDVLLIRKMYATGNYTQSYFKKKYDLNKTTIRNIVINTSWKHLLDAV